MTATAKVTVGGDGGSGGGGGDNMAIAATAAGFLALQKSHQGKESEPPNRIISIPLQVQLFRHPNI